MEISQYSQENTCARVSFESCRVCNFIKKDTLPRCFPGNFAKFARISFLTEHLRLLFLNICNLYLELITSSCDSSFGIVEDFWFRRGYREIPNVCTEFSNTSIKISNSVHHRTLLMLQIHLRAHLSFQLLSFIRLCILEQVSGIKASPGTKSKALKNSIFCTQILIK